MQSPNRTGRRGDNAGAWGRGRAHCFPGMWSFGFMRACDAAWLLISPYGAPGMQAAGRHWLYGHLLAWLLVLQCIETAPPSTRARFVSQLNGLGVVDGLLNLFFRLVLPVSRAPAPYMAAIQELKPNGVEGLGGD